jgi:hypothetical protein
LSCKEGLSHTLVRSHRGPSSNSVSSRTLSRSAAISCSQQPLNHSYGLGQACCQFGTIGNPLRCPKIADRALLSDHDIGVSRRSREALDIKQVDGLDADAHFGIEEILADGDDFVVGRVHIVGQGARSGVPMDPRWVAVTWFHDGKMTRGAGYLHCREALKAVGLEG